MFGHPLSRLRRGTQLPILPKTSEVANHRSGPLKVAIRGALPTLGFADSTPNGLGTLHVACCVKFVTRTTPKKAKTLLEKNKTRTALDAFDSLSCKIPHAGQIFCDRRAFRNTGFFFRLSFEQRKHPCCAFRLQKFRTADFDLSLL